MITIDDETFTQVIQSDEPVLIDFGADWCQPCKIMHPILEEISDEPNMMAIAQIDIDSSPKAKEFAGVMGVPTFVIYQEGKEIKRSSGARSKKKMLEFMNI